MTGVQVAEKVTPVESGSRKTKSEYLENACENVNVNDAPVMTGVVSAITASTYSDPHSSGVFVAVAVGVGGCVLVVVAFQVKVGVGVAVAGFISPLALTRIGRKTPLASNPPIR